MNESINQWSGKAWWSRYMYMYSPPPCVYHHASSWWTTTCMYKIVDLLHHACRRTFPLDDRISPRVFAGVPLRRMMATRLFQSDSFTPTPRNSLDKGSGRQFRGLLGMVGRPPSWCCSSCWTSIIFLVMLARPSFFSTILNRPIPRRSRPIAAEKSAHFFERFASLTVRFVSFVGSSSSNLVLSRCPRSYPPRIFSFSSVSKKLHQMLRYTRAHGQRIMCDL